MDCLIGLVKHAIWRISHTCCYFQFPKFWLHPSLPCDLLHRHAGLVWIFLEDPLRHCAYAARLHVCLFRQCSICHIRRECYRSNFPSVSDIFSVWFSWHALLDQLLQNSPRPWGWNWDGAEVCLMTVVLTIATRPQEVTTVMFRLQTAKWQIMVARHSPAVITSFALYRCGFESRFEDRGSSQPNDGPMLLSTLFVGNQHPSILR